MASKQLILTAVCGSLTIANEQKLSLHCLPQCTTLCEVTKSVCQIKLQTLSMTTKQKTHIITILKLSQQNIEAGKHTLLYIITVFVLLLKRSLCIMSDTEASRQCLHIRGQSIQYWYIAKRKVNELPITTQL